MTRNADKFGTCLLHIIIRPCCTVNIKTLHKLHDLSHTHTHTHTHTTHKHTHLIFPHVCSTESCSNINVLLSSFPSRQIFFVVNFTTDFAFIFWKEIAS